MSRYVAKAVVAAGMALGLLASTAPSANACTNLSVLSGSLQGRQGSVVTLMGHGFDTGSNPVVLHWGSFQGPVIAQSHSDAFGNFKATFHVPQEVSNGTYVIIATQMDKDGQAVFGTPARVSFQVGIPVALQGHHSRLATAGSPVNAPVAAPAATQAALPSWMSSIALIALLGLVVFGIGVMLFAQEVRRTRTLLPAR